MVLAHFPSSKHFFDAWSDPELVRDAYPLRQACLLYTSDAADE